jgi:hypothetical protein
MKVFLAGLRRWYKRRFQGIVEPPPHAKGHGTTWQEHRDGDPFKCVCGWPGPGIHWIFDQNDYVIMSQDHIEDCEGVFDSTRHSVATADSQLRNLVPCPCPVTEARYVKICPTCRRGHWAGAPAPSTRKEE